MPISRQAPGEPRSLARQLEGAERLRVGAQPVEELQVLLAEGPYGEFAIRARPHPRRPQARRANQSRDGIATARAAIRARPTKNTDMSLRSVRKPIELPTSE